MILIPELQYYFNQFVISSILNKYSLPYPSCINNKYFNSSSFIQLMFDDNWPKSQTSYNYLFRKIDRSNYSQPILDMLGIYSQKSNMYISDTTSSATYNLMGLKSDDLEMLDLILGYRLDSTSISINNIEFNLLGTNLSKLMYLYLDLELNSNFYLYNDFDIVSSTVLEMMYECYVIDKMFQYISDKGS